MPGHIQGPDLYQSGQEPSADGTSGDLTSSRGAVNNYETEFHDKKQ